MPWSPVPSARPGQQRPRPGRAHRSVDGHVHRAVAVCTARHNNGPSRPASSSSSSSRGPRRGMVHWRTLAAWFRTASVSLALPRPARVRERQRRPCGGSPPAGRTGQPGRPRQMQGDPVRALCKWPQSSRRTPATVVHNAPGGHTAPDSSSSSGTRSMASCLRLPPGLPGLPLIWITAL